jgi:hypothetical protein
MDGSSSEQPGKRGGLIQLAGLDLSTSLFSLGTLLPGRSIEFECWDFSHLSTPFLPSLQNRWLRLLSYLFAAQRLCRAIPD